MKKISYKHLINALEKLGIEGTASLNEVKAAYHRKAAEIHPDASRENTSHQQTIELIKSYELIKDFINNFPFDFKQLQEYKGSFSRSDYQGWWDKNYKDKMI